MSTPSLVANAAAQAEASPVDDFSNCHVGIVRQLDALAELPALLEPAQRSRALASQIQAFFRDVVLEHHTEEERDLFPAVLASAKPGAERETVQAAVASLTAEHRHVEAQFAHIEPALKKIAKGQDAQLAPSDVADLVRIYKAHAAYEEAHFLPLAQEILGRNPNHLAALGISLHMRHARPIVGHL